MADEPEAAVLPPVRDAEPLVDVTAESPRGEPCASCGCPVETADRFCPACGTPHETPPGAPPSAAPQKRLKCNACGAQIASEIDRRSYTCPFCDSNYVVDLPEESSGRQPPEFVIGFAVSRDQASEKFQEWMGRRGWFTPSDLRAAMASERLQGVYLPFWSFSMLAVSQWRADIGEYWYRTETYYVTNAKGERERRTRRVRETEWWPLAGNHHRFYSGYLVSASQGLPQAEAERIMPFQLPALKRFEPYFLAGWLSEEYTLEREQALERSHAEFHRREHSHIAAFLPGDTHANLEVVTQFSHQNSDLCLLPVYILPFTYRGQRYRFLINGQTGKCYGRKPFSVGRLAAAIGLGFAAVGLVLLLLWLISMLSGA
jgi:hypothetical protein